MKVGFIGPGNMGSGIAANLLKAGLEFMVYNRMPSKARALVACIACAPLKPPKPSNRYQFRSHIDSGFARLTDTEIGCACNPLTYFSTPSAMAVGEE
jgi:3-hydroxyacyl-CoA dehydrogenase